jgi:tRNA G18 (ribose-2'-O)-methylase SpoU
MLEIQQVSDFERPELAPYRTMRRHQEHRARRIFVAEGVKIVRRLLESQLGVVSVLMPEDWFARFRPLLESRPEPLIHVFLAEKKMVEQLIGFSMFQGVLAVGRMPEELPLEDLLRLPSPRLFVAVDGLANAENIGAVVRCCGAFCVQALIASETSSSPYVRRSVRSGMGVVFKLPVIESKSLVNSLAGLRAGGMKILAAHPRPEARRLSQVDLTGDCCLVFGSEGNGMSEPVLAACDEVAAIPMPSHVDSLNVSHAAAAFLYEACRQRGMT